MQNKYNPLDLSRELGKSRINLDLNEIQNKNKFLEIRVWDSLNDNKIPELDKKVEEIYNGFNKEHLKETEQKINNYNFDEFYKYYNPIQNTFSIGVVCDLNCLVDSTYNVFGISEEERSYDISKLTECGAFKFRSILGDGECFYRSLIFSILENIILINNIMQMKELLILFHEKMNPNNILINEKEYLKIILNVKADEISEILYILITQMEKKIETAYTTLLKVFICNSDFDFGIVLFTRYLLYEYISSNEDKIYSKEYMLEIGCLLPDEYIVDRGNKNEYFFENFFYEHLMNPKTYAEKMVLYIAPFVFDINMNILSYDYGEFGKRSVITVKQFNYRKENNFKYEINLLFRKNHYDVYYKLEFIEDNEEKYLNILDNKNKNIDAFEQNQIDLAIQENINDNNFNKNHINNNLPNYNDNNKNENSINEIIMEENNKDKQNNNNNSNLNNNKDIPNDLYNLFSRDKYKTNNIPQSNNNHQDNKNSNLPTCLECKKHYIKEDPLFGLCDRCLLNNLKSFLLSAYLEFLRPENLVNSYDKFRALIKEKKCRISVQDNITLHDAIYNSKFKINELLLDIQNSICLFCGKNFNNQNEYYIELPCKCKFCCERCFISYWKVIKQHVTLQDRNNTSHYRYLNLLTCFCGFVYNTQNVLYMINETTIRNLLEQRNMYVDYIDNFWNWICCMCKKNFTATKTFYKFNFHCENLNGNLIGPNIRFKHLICNDCFLDYNINQIKNIICNICELEHSILEINKVNKYNVEINNNNFNNNIYI